jgi:hypothetical protein
VFRDLIGSMVVLWALALLITIGVSALGQPVLGVFLGVALVMIVSNRKRLLGLFK